MPGPTLQQRLEHAITGLEESEREYAAGLPYPDHSGQGSWPERIDHLKQHIAELREMIANEPANKPTSE